MANTRTSGDERPAVTRHARSELITLTGPGGDSFVPIARIVVGGLSARLNVPYESLDDLQLAVESVLGEARYQAAGEVSVELSVRERSVGIAIGPVSEAIEADLDDGRAFGIALVLPSVVDSVELVERDGERWIRFEKQVALPPGT